MSSEHQQVDASEKRSIDGHRLSEFIYGTVTALVAIAGISTETEASWSNAVAIIVIGAAAVWASHAYSHAISQRIAGGHRLHGHEIWEILRGSWPIVIAGILVAAPFLLVAIGIITMPTALDVASLLGLAILAIVGYLSGVVTGEAVPRRFMLAALSLGLGLIVVMLEFAIHH